MRHHYRTFYTYCGTVNLQGNRSTYSIGTFIFAIGALLSAPRFASAFFAPLLLFLTCIVIHLSMIYPVIGPSKTATNVWTVLLETETVISLDVRSFRTYVFDVLVFVNDCHTYKTWQSFTNTNTSNPYVRKNLTSNDITAYVSNSSVHTLVVFSTTQSSGISFAATQLSSSTLTVSKNRCFP